MKERLSQVDRIADLSVRAGLMPACTLLSSDVGSATWLTSMESFNGGEVEKGSLLIVATAVYVFLAGFSVAYAGGGDKFLKDFLALVNAPSRLRN